MIETDRLVTSIEASIPRYERAVHLTKFLTGYVGRPFAPGDCSFWLADWWQVNHGADPAHSLRAIVRSEASKLRVVAEAGSVAELVEGVAASVSAEPTASPSRGDFGVIRNGALEVGAICCGDMWAVRSEDGVTFLRSPDVIKAWRI